MASGDNILASDFNNIRNKVALVLGSGSGTYGYGQSLNSSAETTGQPVDAAGWSDLRNDIININLHQTGSQPSLTNPSSGDVIFYGSSHPNNSYDTLIDSLTSTRFNLAASRTTLSGKPGGETTANWSDLAYCTATMTFSSADEARHFFNAGASFKINSYLISDDTPQSNSWESLLDSLSDTVIDHSVAYSLTNSNQLLYSITDSGAYSTNEFRVYARCNVADNSSGTATTFYVYVEWDDNHTNQYYDTVGGTLRMTVNEAKGSGSMLPSGTFTITSPTYSCTAISAS